MLPCYRALIELDHPDSAIHAAAILDRHADCHPAVVQVVAGGPRLALTLPADDLAHAVRTVFALLRVTGHRPVRSTMMTLGKFDEVDQR